MAMKMTMTKTVMMKKHNSECDNDKNDDNNGHNDDEDKMTMMTTLTMKQWHTTPLDNIAGAHSVRPKVTNSFIICCWSIPRTFTNTKRQQ